MANENEAAPTDFLHFFEATFPRLFAGALMLAGNRFDAEDAVQEAYAEALLRWDRVGTYDAPDAWVRKVVRQRLWKASRRWRRLSSLESMELAAWRASDGSPEQAVEARATLAALAKLPHRQRTVMIMLSVFEMTPQEIAKELGLTGTAVRQPIYRARRKLEKMLGVPRAGHVSADGLASVTGPVFDYTQAAEDRPAAALREAENWLREGIEANERGRDRIRREVLAAAARGRSR
jgi:RNA polymerase sigma-70 factor (ECF subfamily)